MQLRLVHVQACTVVGAAGARRTPLGKQMRMECESVWIVYQGFGGMDARFFIPSQAEVKKSSLFHLTLKNFILFLFFPLISIVTGVFYS